MRVLKKHIARNKGNNYNFMQNINANRLLMMIFLNDGIMG